jgi:predicted transcriptional regulator
MIPMHWIIFFVIKTMKELIGKISQKDVIKAMKRGSREAELELSTGWVAKDRPHKNKRKYDRNSQKKHPLL